MLRKYLVGFILVLFVSCSSDDEGGDADQEQESLIVTTVELRLEPIGGGDVITTRNFDSNGFVIPGGTVPGDDTTGDGQFNTTYNGSLRFLNESPDNPPIDLTQQVIDNGTRYQVNFGLLVAEEPYTYEYLPPFDENGEVIGINFLINTNDENCGIVFLTLIEDPIEKTAVTGTATEDLAFGEIVARISNLTICEE